MLNENMCNFMRNELIKYLKVNKLKLINIKCLLKDILNEDYKTIQNIIDYIEEIENFENEGKNDN